MQEFTHLHCHTQYSLLDGAAQISALISQAAALHMKALAITDHGNMFGVPHFVTEAKKKGIKPIIGCEFYLAPDMQDFKEKKRYHQLLLAKNEIGYKNISRLCSLGFIEGYYYKPRIDKNLLKKYQEGLIATTCCLAGEVPQAILNKGEKEAEEIFLDWLELFGEDYYIELQRHGIKEQEICNEVLLKWAKKYQVKVIATNDVHYVSQQDSIAQDVLLCLQTNKDYHDPNRMRFENDQFFLKAPQAMAELFHDIPDAVINTQDIVDKIYTPSLERDILLPMYQLPAGFTDQNAYLRQLAISGAHKRYQSITSEIQTRLDYELDIIEKMGFPGYFLIVQDFIQAAHELGVFVGPGRGSVSGSVVAYCIGITNIDPLYYNLVFERFLNPERISMPDIDIDFDDEGRQKVIKYVANKYGKNQVAHIITFGSMAAKSAIKDVARVLNLPLDRANYLAKLVPDKLGSNLTDAFEEVPELALLKNEPNKLESRILNLAATLEGCARHTGVHAAGIIIAPDDLLNYIPVKTDKNAALLVTQYDGSVVEKLGMLKMDFLGLKTLSIIKDALVLIEKHHGIKVDLDKLPLDDPKTFALYQGGHTIATFQFESEGMRQWLKKLKPTHFEDLIAMNALYRPGPMQFIPNFVARKHGQEKIEYPHPLLADILKHTYGIMVYQEQVMQTAQIIAGYTLGGADILRKAMGKKQADEMAKQKDIFVNGTQAKHNISKEQALKIFAVMEKFAQYGFNRAHAAAYSVIAYQTAYLKANYPAAYMAAVLTHNQHDISKISFFLNECHRQGIKVLGPDINESQLNFDLNSEQQIRFGLGAIKGVGEAAVEHIIIARKEGRFEDIFDFLARVDFRAVNKKALESLAMSGAFDSFQGMHRRQYLFAPNGEVTFLERTIQYCNQIKNVKEATQQSLFGMDTAQLYGTKPVAIECEPYEPLEKFRIEKNLVGFYISGHPLDMFRIELTHFCNCHTQNVLDFKQQEVRFAGMISECTIRHSKQGRPFALFSLEDYVGTLDIALFGEDFLKHKHMLHKGMFVYIVGLVSVRYNQPDVWEVRPQKINLLSEVREQLSKKLLIKVPLQNITSKLVEEIQNLLMHFPGNCNLYITVEDAVEGFSIEFSAHTQRIYPANELFDKLNQITGISYHLISA